MEISVKIDVEITLDDSKIEALSKIDLMPGNELLCIDSKGASYFNSDHIYTVDVLSQREVWILDNCYNDSEAENFNLSDLLYYRHDMPVFVSWTNMDAETKTSLKLKHKLIVVKEDIS